MMKIKYPHIRKAKSADYESVNSLYYFTYNIYHKNIPETYKTTPETLLSRGTYLNILEDKNALLIIAELDNKPIGLLYAIIESDEDDDVTYGYHRVSVEEISVHPDYRNHNIGTALMKEVENWAKDNKIADLTSLVYAFNQKAVNFYKKNGYKPYSIKINKKLSE